MKRLDKSKIGKIDDNMIAAYDLALTVYDLAYMELHNQLAFIRDDWKVRKITKTAAEAVDGEWALFNLKDDPY